MAEIFPVLPLPAPLPTPITAPLPAAGSAAAGADDLRRVAREFETAFLTEMLKHAGIGRMPETFNGGVGEEGFADMLTREYAAEIARTGRLGLAKMIWQSLEARGGQ